MLRYFVRRTNSTPELTADWQAPIWQSVIPVDIAFVSPLNDSSLGPFPAVQAKLLHDDANIYGIYRVTGENDLRCENTCYHGKIWEDSCVELFLEPCPNAGYFNLEMNVGGYHLIDYNVLPPNYISPKERKTTFLPEEEGGQIQIITKADTPGLWTLQFALPIHILAKYLPAPPSLSPGTVWRGSFYKCSDCSARPHWLSWQPLEITAFHHPRTFGEIIFQ